LVTPAAGAAGLPPRVNLLGVGVHALDLPAAVAIVERWIAERERCAVHVCAVQTVMECRRDARLRGLVNRGDLATPDGMPLVWWNRLHGHRRSARVYGPDLMLALCARSGATGHRHFFYGSTADVLADLERNLRARYPELQVAGTYAPALMEREGTERPDVLAAIDRARPDVVWVGLGTPKQDFWVARHRQSLAAPVLIAVGAAFDFHAGRLRQAPRWMQRAGLEWLFRLACEPRRLASRYLVNVPWFLFLAALQALRLRRFSLE
jgi:N-acetylglucosaminyldiphosphoundecaprenol N-acetyl-beta-D-mannosaminyltransferase